MPPLPTMVTFTLDSVMNGSPWVRGDASPGSSTLPDILRSQTDVSGGGQGHAIYVPAWYSPTLVVA